MTPPQFTRRRRSLWLLPLMLLATACTSRTPEQQGSTSDAYAVVLQWFAKNAATALERPVVYVEARGEGLGVGLDTQAAIVASTADFADVRFIDDRSEALDSDGVRDGGVFVALGPLIDDGRDFTIECDQILSEDASIVWTFSLSYSGEVWSLTAPPVQATG